MSRFTRALLTVLVALSIAVASVATAAPTSATAPGGVKVVIIVGPVGRLTPTFRRLASEAAAVARRYTDNVVEIYTPNATWPIVRRALQGASIVAYLGHGNGWPSPYRDAPHSVTQNGFGLNTVAGVDDSAHQYFGERYIAREIRLAPDAVVLLHHLCYASGNSEPGRPEPSLEVAEQRADNFAAGFIKSGASAVVAEGHLGPAFYVRGIFEGGQTIEDLWRDSPNYRGHVIDFPSVRSAGRMAFLDPDRRSSGYYRSLVVEPGATTDAVLRSGAGVPIISNGETARSLASLGFDFGAPSIDGRPLVGRRATLTLPIDAPPKGRLSRDTLLGFRWDPIETLTGLPSGLEPSATPGDGQSGEAAAEPPTVEAIQPEQLGTLVTVSNARVKASQISAPIAFPEHPGTYRLVVSVHDPDGVAYDANTQTLIPALIVHVAGDLWADYRFAEASSTTTGIPFVVPLRLANTGALPWEADAAWRVGGGNALRSGPQAHLEMRWLSLGGVREGPSVDPEAPNDVLLPTIEPGGEALLKLELVAPPGLGDYLLVVDVVSPVAGSLAASGVPAGILRVHVSEPVPPTKVPPQSD
jgi:hypothetical protein